MRRLTACVLMMTLLLCSCKAAGGEIPEEAALAVRDAYLDGAGWNADADITASVGNKVFDFTLAVQWRREGETVLSITAPELLAGITARLAKGETVLEYDGAGLSLGLLDDSGLTPVSAVTACMEQIQRGWMAKCAWAGENDAHLQISFQDPEREDNAGTQFLLTFDRAGYALLSAEVSAQGRTVLSAQFSDFTMEMMNPNDAGDSA